MDDFHSFAVKLGLPEQTMKVIEHIRSSPPSRRVRSGRNNVTGRYPSVKMKFSIQFESHTLELANVYTKEHDLNVLEYYDQPPSFPIQYNTVDKNGRERNTGHMYTADYFVIEKEWIGWEECKKEEDLIRLAIQYPSRYSLDDKGVWRCPPAEEYAKDQGLSFRIVTDKQMNKTYLRNIVFLEDYLQHESDNELEISEDIVNVVSQHPGIRIESLIRDYSIEADHIYTAIIREVIYVDLKKHILAEVSIAEVYIDETAATAYSNILSAEVEKEYNESIINVQPGSSILWDGKKWTFINIGESEYSLIDDEDKKLITIPTNIFKRLLREGKIAGVNYSNDYEQENIGLKRIKEASKEQLETANYRFHLVTKHMNGEQGLELPERTLSDWLKKYKDAEIKYGNGYIGLIDVSVNRGNRDSRFPQDVINIVENYITQYYETIVQRNRSTVYKLMVEACSSKGLSPPSFVTFCKMIQNHSTVHEQTKRRKGSKAAYATEGFYWELEQDTPRHGDRPFEIVHIDHTELDLELVCSKTGRNLGRPWVTFMVDAFSRRLLAVYITFEEPSYRSCMMVIRECVRQHQRLPSKVVVDGGKEFRSTYFETLLSWYKITKLERPGAKPRFGSVCERLFGTTNTTFINNLVGNTQATKNVRQMTMHVNPKNNAVWNLGAFFERLCEWAYELYDTIDHPALGSSPREAYHNGLISSGKRKFTMVSYDEVFYMLTLPTTRSGKAKIIPGHGVKINYQYFWSDKFLNPEAEGTKVSVRYDPYNMGIAYALVGKQWVKLISSHYSSFVNRTEKEIRKATEEIKRRAKLHNKQLTITAAKIAKFLNSTEAQETLLNQRLRDNEQKVVLEVIEGGKHDNKLNKGQSNETNSVVSLNKISREKKLSKPSFNRLEEL